LVRTKVRFSRIMGSRRMARSWILLGMMGAGKSSVGRVLAQISGRTFLDTDSMLHHKLGRPVHQLFAVYGEEAFRDHETYLLKSMQPDSNVIATGGGIVLRPENWVEMKRLGTTIFLNVDPATLRDRLENSKRRRPLLETENWEERLLDLLEKRRSLYEQADVTVDVTGLDQGAAAKRILESLDGREAPCIEESA